MALSWNEIKDRALKFSKDWADTVNEDAEAKPFLVEFFNVFGISRKKVATFEHRVKKLDTHDGNSNATSKTKKRSCNKSPFPFPSPWPWRRCPKDG